MAGTFVFPDDVPTLTDADVTLRAHALSDVDAAVEQCTDPLSIEWTTVPVPFAREDAVHFVTEIMPGGWRSGRELGFAVEATHPSGERRFSGSVSLRVHGDGVAEIAYGLHPAVRGRGVALSAVKLLLDWGFEVQGFDVVLWFAQVGNWASRRVAWASGFAFDGTVAKLLLQRGVRHDAWGGSLRAEDTREPKSTWNEVPVLESPRLRLRPHRESDATRFGETVFDPRSRHFNGRMKAIRDIADGSALILRNVDGVARGDRYNWTIAHPESDLMIGHIQLFDLDGLDDTAAKLGYSVHPDSRGRGVLTEALRMVVEWSFRPVEDGGLGKRRLSLTTAASNKASRHAVEQVGFVHVATEPLAFTTGEEGFEDTATYHRLNPNWAP
ncbi:MAG: GNAT family N-acetyltransferase [Actinophytocola sp.]|uniref:GNAT family N-acetyltransferase n=1 Tax=Actinophytocola sp. TaxID=1872138 RepID=UPI0013268E24|nr:GNAT family N-acetyltransferase [Actinophytocola sp.]MPZ80764.1 GNAT family N-acetyltransferase [Actinophytocola sp.]